MKLSAAAEAMQGELIGDDGEFTSVSTDTRSLQVGQLFFALSGEHFDAHHFLEQAQEKGALACVIEKPTCVAQLQIPCLIVKNAKLALGQLAKAWRSQTEMQSLQMVSLTGSCGKTTVKEMIGSILSEQGKTLVTAGNFNNDIGVPLTLFRLQQGDQYAVTELGANHHGEIAYTVALTQPDVALITNAAKAHLEGFGSLEGVAEAKGEIYAGLTEQGCALINRDDAFFEYWKELVDTNVHCKTISFGVHEAADVRAQQIEMNSQGCFAFRLQLDAQQVAIRLQVMGYHNVLNALAAAASAHALGISSDKIKTGLEKVKPVKGRLAPHQTQAGVTLVDDTYNANEKSVQAAIDLLSELPGPRCLVLGDVGELGSEAEQIHKNIGRYAKQSAVEELIAVGELAALAAEEFGEGSTAVDSHEQAVEQLLASPIKSILVKGSRFMTMEKVVNGLLEKVG